MVRELRTRGDLQPLWAAVRAARDELPALAAELCEIPAPTFQEEDRAKVFAAKLAEACRRPVERDVGLEAYLLTVLAALEILPKDS